MSTVIALDLGSGRRRSRAGFAGLDWQPVGLRLSCGFAAFPRTTWLLRVPTAGSRVVYPGCRRPLLPQDGERDC